MRQEMERKLKSGAVPLFSALVSSIDAFCTHHLHPITSKHKAPVQVSIADGVLCPTALYVQC